MPNTRGKKIKTVYKDDDDCDQEETGDFSDSGSEAHITEQSESSEEDYAEVEPVSPEITKKKLVRTIKNKNPPKASRFAKNFINKINRQKKELSDNEDEPFIRVITVKDLSEADKLLPSVLNLSESDSSDDEKPSTSKQIKFPEAIPETCEESDSEIPLEYKDVWSKNSEELAKQTFDQLQQHANKIEETKSTLQNYSSKITKLDSNIQDLLAMGEEIPKVISKKKRPKNMKDDSESEPEDWEEVNESKPIPQQGIQLVVDFPDAAYKKPKTVDIEMMMRRKINRVKKEYQVYVHKVHVLCWLGHGNHVSQVLNNQEVMAAALSLVPSKTCYPGERVDMKYVEQITSWYQDKLKYKYDKHEDKYKPKSPPLNEILISQIKTKVITSKKYLVFIFVSMLRALGLQCRVIFNFVALPLKPPQSELCSLSVKKNDIKETKTKKKEVKEKESLKSKNNTPIPQLDGAMSISSDDDTFENIVQLDGNNDKKRLTRSTKHKENAVTEDKNVTQTRTTESKQAKSEQDNIIPATVTKKRMPKSVKKKHENPDENDEDISPPKVRKISVNREELNKNNVVQEESIVKHRNVRTNRSRVNDAVNTNVPEKNPKKKSVKPNTEKTVSNSSTNLAEKELEKTNPKKIPKIIVTSDDKVSSEFFGKDKKTLQPKNLSLSRKRSQTANPKKTEDSLIDNTKCKAKTRTKSDPGTSVDVSKYFPSPNDKSRSKRPSRQRKPSSSDEDDLRVSHRDLMLKYKKSNIQDDSKVDSKPQINKKCIKVEEKRTKRISSSDDDFKPSKIIPKKTIPKIDRRVLSSDDDSTKKTKKIDVWCEIFVEELEQWIAVDVINAKIHCTKELYAHCTQPVAYIVGWDNNNHLKDVTRRYVPHWNTVTRKLRSEPAWWGAATRSWLGPNNARDKEENEQLDRQQLEAPLPKTISEYKNHPLYALKRHLLKFEAIYPPNAATLGFVREEAVYARECVHVCRSRDTWLKEAMVVRLGEQPYKIVKARPKWDKLSNKMITDKPLEVFGPWQVDPYEPPEAENGMVPRNAYGNVELFKECMLPKGTVHLRLPGLNKVARKLNIDAAPAMTGFDFNGGWTHPVFDGFVVCKEFEEILREAHREDQEEQIRKEKEKLDARVYGNWKKLIKGLLIRERVKIKYGFNDLSPSDNKKKKATGPRFVVKKK